MFSKISRNALRLGLVGLLLGGALFASPMTPAQNASWIALACIQESNTVRSDADCVHDKCAALYPPATNPGAYWDCINAACPSAGCIIVVITYPTPPSHGGGGYGTGP